MEYTYGDKINAMFDMITSMNESLVRTNNQIETVLNKLDKHDDELFSHNFRITKLENEFKQWIVGIYIILNKK